MTKLKNSTIVLLAFTMMIISGTALAAPQAHESMHAKGVITAISDQNADKSIQIGGIDTQGLVLNIAEDTIIQKADGTALSFAELKLGAQIEAEHSIAMTLSLPPQTAAFKITVMDQSKDEIIGTAGVIEEILTSVDGVISLEIKGSGLTEKSPSHVVLRLTDSTLFVNPKGEAVKKNEFVKGAQVIGFYSPKLTKSLPPIGIAWKVVLEPTVE